MNREIFFKSPTSQCANAVLTCLMALSLGISANLSCAAKDASTSSQAKKTDKSAQASTDKKDDKSDKSEKKDEKSDKKDDKATAKDAKSTDKAKEAAVSKPEPVIENVVSVSAEDLVDKPHEYLGKNVKFSAPFFAFSNLALDYKPAYKPAKTHISLLVSRNKNHKIPLSELKLAMMTPPEKDPETTLLAGLKEGDILEITGKVFSAALDDPWVDILRLKKTSSAPDDKKADASKAKTNDTKPSDSKDDKGSGGKSDDAKSPPKN